MQGGAIKRLSAEQRAAMRAALIADPGLSTVVLAQSQGVSRSTVAKLRRRMLEAGELQAPPQVRRADGALILLNKRPAEQRIEQIRAMLDEGYSIRQIARRQGVGEDRVNQILRNFKIKPPSAVVDRGMRRFDARRVVEGTVAAAYGIVQGVELLKGQPVDIDPDSAKQLLADLRAGIKALNTVASLLKTRINPP